MDGVEFWHSVTVDSDGEDEEFEGFTQMDLIIIKWILYVNDLNFNQINQICFSCQKPTFQSDIHRYLIYTVHSCNFVPFWGSFHFSFF